ncbi:MAG: Fe-S oxidoreductase [Bacteroidetes bacterium 24-39-8]|jgi:L-lactate dehydrogenase complex protein LldE|nr:MAG: Fe-S oxidoreductase [Sphingobacteriia bacterium 35-40-8]OYZ52571.1 MAG: Fe-S oxidoreductase [Bacteroidetes bacterium 24-39-8]OZA63699.1 MAG: Fe-S oxidoreductase [Sphingobacteriia bacterium 39-39-8]HQR92870.1 (Fe-S)-binding protein [Sediminibacterium sp.]HQS53622.1 (Fe-S)-binding protein [Sediminibacterium sp.]
MKIGLFIPCYIDQFYPAVGVASLELLEKLGCEVSFPLNQTCCGQPMANSGFEAMSKGCDKNFVKNFKGFDYIVAPSGSCVLHIKEHLHDEDDPKAADVIRSRVYELTEFLIDVLKIEKLNASFPFKVGLHTSCHGQRGLHLASMSELVAPAFSKPGALLNMVKGIELTRPKRVDECCGFGGTFCVFEEAVSVKMGKDRIDEHQDNDVQYITGVDTSCLMHLEGILRRQNSPIKTIHIAEILNSQL